MQFILMHRSTLHVMHRWFQRYVQEIIITFDIINAMRYYEMNDKEFREQRNRKIIQTGIITKDP